MSNPDLSFLIAPYTVADFLQQYWQESPLLIKTAAVDRFHSLVPAKDVAAMLAIVEQFPVDAVDLVGQTRTVPRGSESSGTLAEFFLNGSTIRAKGLERYLGTLKQLCRCIENEFHFPTRANLYCTPATSRGFDLHFDTHDVLVLQLLGKKCWQVYQPLMKFPLEHLPALGFEDDPESLRRSRGGRVAGQDNVSPAELGAVALEATLEPGDCLYLPRGFVHQAESLDEPSVHLTIGIHAFTWLDLLAVALGQTAYRNETLRQALPIGSLEEAETSNNWGREFAQRIQLFGQEADFERAFAELIASFNRSRGADPSTVSSESVNCETRLEGNGQLQHYLSGDGTLAGLALGQDIFWMPSSFAPAIRFVVEHQSFCPHELPGQMTDNGKLAFLRRLIADGFLRVAD